MTSWLAVVCGALTLLLPIAVVGPPEYPNDELARHVMLLFLAATLGPLIYWLVESTTAWANRAR